MLQIVEYDPERKRFAEGPGQEIETEIAKELGVKIFRVEVREAFEEHHTEALWRRIDRWISDNSVDSSIDTVAFEDTVQRKAA